MDVVLHIGVFDHDHGVGAARRHAAGRNRDRLAGRQFEVRADSRRQHFAPQVQQGWRLLVRADNVGGPHREAVEIGAIEAGHVDTGGDIAGEHATQGFAQGYGFLARRRQPYRGLETTFCFVTIHDLQELLLMRTRGHGDHFTRPGAAPLSRKE